LIERCTFWPRDLLPEKVPHARILTYGYDASQNGIFEHSQNLLEALKRLRKEKYEKRRPIIFVAHSFGGILVKDTLRQAQGSSDEVSACIHKSTYAVVFLGCPHRGTKNADLGLLVSNLCRFLIKTPNKRVLQQLKANNDVLQIIAEEFKKNLNVIRVHSFYEEKAMTGFNGFHGKVVENWSAKIDGLREGTEGINADHVGMVKFEGPQDEGFKKVSERLAVYLRDIEEQGYLEPTYSAENFLWGLTTGFLLGLGAFSIYCYYRSASGRPSVELCQPETLISQNPPLYRILDLIISVLCACLSFVLRPFGSAGKTV
jgi:hypothetical protein